MAVHYMPNNRSFPRLGIVVGKKLVRRAHDRNYIKRVLREMFRLHGQSCAPMDMVIRVHKAFGPADFHQLESEFVGTMDRILQKARKTVHGVR
jgi:ribonuclease P protein component